MEARNAVFLVFNPNEKSDKPQTIILDAKKINFLSIVLKKKKGSCHRPCINSQFSRRVTASWSCTGLLTVGPTEK